MVFQKMIRRHEIPQVSQASPNRPPSPLANRPAPIAERSALCRKNDFPLPLIQRKAILLIGLHVFRELFARRFRSSNDVPIRDVRCRIGQTYSAFGGLSNLVNMNWR